VLYQILKSPYNHYSPILEHEEIERIRNEKFDYSESVQSYEPFQLKQSSRVRYNLVSGMWTAEDGSTTNLPFGVHQIYEEIVAPVVQNLMNENRIERLKIYNHIKDQKIEYLNRWHENCEDFYGRNRAEAADIIRDMGKSLQEYVAAYNTLVSLQRTEDSMVLSKGNLDSTVVDVVDSAAETLLAFEAQSNEFKRTQLDFEEYMERLKDDIDEKAAKFGYIEYYDAKLRDGHSNEVAVAASEVHDLDDRRKPLALVNPLFAKSSELPPSPNIEDITFEHIALNLPIIAKNALENLENNEQVEETETPINRHSDESHNPPIDEAVVEEEIEGQARNDAEEEESHDESEEDDNEDYQYSEEELNDLDDAVLQQILDELGLEYDADEFVREYAIFEILENQGEFDNENENENE
jgi:hypothetical protein